MRIGARITSGIWVSIPFTLMGFMMGGWIVAILLFIACIFLWPIFIVDFLKEEHGKTLLKVCGFGYLLVGLYGTLFEPTKVPTSLYPGYQFTGWYFISILSLIVCVAYFVVGFDLLERQNKKPVIEPKDKFINETQKKSNMTPQEFEQFVAQYYSEKGYDIEITPYSGDYGVDVIAQKGEERIAIQAKMYGNSARKVNRETVMQLFGAMTYRKCNKAVIATDGTCMPDAIDVANQLGVEVLYLAPKGIVERQNEKPKNKREIPSANNNDVIQFDEMWEKYIIPLSGKTITNDGLTNKIVNVDWGGLKRLSSNGKVSRIRIEEFRIVYNMLLTNGYVERTLINQHASRCSSAIFLIMSQVPFIGIQDKPKKTLYLK